MSIDTAQATFDFAKPDTESWRINVLEETNEFQWQQISRLKMLIGVLRQEVKAAREVTDLAAADQKYGNKWVMACRNQRIAREATDAANALEERPT